MSRWTLWGLNTVGVCSGWPSDCGLESRGPAFEPQVGCLMVE
jgi:hypothetical protein